MAKNCKKQLIGAENRKRAKVKAIKTANVLPKLPNLMLILILKMQLIEQKIHQVLIFIKSISIIFHFHFILNILILIYLQVGIERKSIVDENSDDIIETVNCNLSAKQPKTSEINISINEEKIETN